MVVMAAPGMFCLPFIMKAMEKKAWFRSRPALHGPFQVAGVGCILLFMVPFACALFPQNVEITPEYLRQKDPEAYSQLQAKPNSTEASLQQGTLVLLRNKSRHLYFKC